MYYTLYTSIYIHNLYCKTYIIPLELMKYNLIWQSIIWYLQNRTWSLCNINCIYFNLYCLYNNMSICSKSTLKTNAQKYHLVIKHSSWTSCTNGVLMGKNIYTWRLFHCYVQFPEGSNIDNNNHQTTQQKKRFTGTPKLGTSWTDLMIIHCWIIMNHPKKCFQIWPSVNTIINHNW